MPKTASASSRSSTQRPQVAAVSLPNGRVICKAKLVEPTGSGRHVPGFVPRLNVSRDNTTLALGAVITGAVVYILGFGAWMYHALSNSDALNGRNRQVQELLDEMGGKRQAPSHRSDWLAPRDS